jgi:hypothetical protein
MTSRARAWKPTNRQFATDVAGEVSDLHVVERYVTNPTMAARRALGAATSGWLERASQPARTLAQDQALVRALNRAAAGDLGVDPNDATAAVLELCVVLDIDVALASDHFMELAKASKVVEALDLGDLYDFRDTLNFDDANDFERALADGVERARVLALGLDATRVRKVATAKHHARLDLYQLVAQSIIGLSTLAFVHLHDVNPSGATRSDELSGKSL